MMYEFPDGRTVAMISSGDISMAAESVLIQPAGGTWDNGWLPNMQVRCMFELVNNTDEEQFISVGFPLDAKYGNAYTAMDEEMLFEELSRSCSEEERLPWQNEMVVQGLDAAEDIPEELDFRTFVNGEEIQVYYRKCALSLEDDILWRPVVAVWKMHFDPGETTVLENTYNTSWDYFGGGPWNSSTVNYILTSGGTWSGPIGDAVITLIVPEELSEPCLNDTLLSFWHWTGTPVVDGRTVTWHYREFEPDENISFSVEESIHLGFWENGINPERMYDSITWTEEDLQRSTVEYLNEGNFWGIQSDTRLTLRIAEALPWLIQGAVSPNGIELHYFSVSEGNTNPVITPEMEDRLAIVHGLQDQMETNMRTCEDAGYLEFLPMFVSGLSQAEPVLGMYAGMPEKEMKYLDLLEYLEPAVEGRFIQDAEVRSFYELTGWYSQGNAANRPFIPSSEVVTYRGN